MASVKQVKDGFFPDLPEETQSKIMAIHKLLLDTCKDVWQDPAYDPIRDFEWAQSAIDEFCEQPADKINTGSVRSYKQGKRYSCMIQLSGHFTNHRNDIDHELLHDYIRNVHQKMKTKVRRQFNMRLTCESEHGEPFEGFDVWPSSAESKVIWDYFADKKIKKIKPMKENADIGDFDPHEYMFAEYYDLPINLQDDIINYNANITESIFLRLDTGRYDYLIENHPNELIDFISENFYATSSSCDDIGSVTLYREDNKYGGFIEVTGTSYLPQGTRLCERLVVDCQINDPTKTLILETAIDNSRCYKLLLEDEYAEKLWDFMERNEPCDLLVEKKTREKYVRDRFKKKWDYNPIDSTINVDGKRVKVDLSGNDEESKLLAYANGQRIPRQISASLNGDEKIILHDNFFKLKNDKRRDAILQHEIGHLKMHRIEPDQSNDQLFDRRFASKENIIAIYRTLINQMGFSPEQSETVLNGLMNDPSVKKYINSKKSDIPMQTARKDLLDALDRQLPKNNSHLNITEIEADRYSANRTSPSQLKQAIRDVTRHTKRDSKNITKAGVLASNWAFGNVNDYLTNEAIAATRKLINTQNAEDYRARSKQLKNPMLIHSDLYKPEHESFELVVESAKSVKGKTVIDKIGEMILHDVNGQYKYKVSQSDANTIANVFNSDIMKSLGNIGYGKIHIKLTNNPNNIFEFKIPSIDSDFIGRFIEGRETIDGFLHRNPDINIIMSKTIFNTIRKPQDIYNFFIKAIKYYCNDVNKYSEQMMMSAIKLPMEIRRLIATSVLKGIIAMPLKLLFVFDQVDMSKSDIFTVSKSDISAINQFISSIPTRYKSPKSEKMKILNDVKTMIKLLKSNTEINESTIINFASELESLYEGNYNNTIQCIRNEFITENIDMNWDNNPTSSQLRYVKEKFGVKKLKRLPSDLVAYISIETEAIKTSNDKMMIASYCISKIEIVEWYIELLDTDNKRYIVPHTRPYLVTLKSELMECYKNIMAVKISNPADKPLIDIDYPDGFKE